MNNRLSLEFGEAFARIPLTSSPRIVCGDALEVDWGDVLPPAECDYVLGNPPFGGSKYQSEEQRAQVKRIANVQKGTGTLDYVTAWFLKAGEYLQKGLRDSESKSGERTEAQAKGPMRIGFVATNSITQGEQVAALWPLIFDRLGLEIAFAHRTFAWKADIKGMAHVHVVIVGLALAADAPADRRLFSYPDVKGDAQESSHAAISPYLFDASGLDDPHLVVRNTRTALNGLPAMIIGSKPIDGGHYIFTDEQRETFLESEPGAALFLRPYIGSREFIQGGRRHILALHQAPPQVLSALPLVRERVASVRTYRAGRSSKPTQALAETPKLYHVDVLPEGPFLVVPKVSSERRHYVPIGWLEPPTIPSDLVFVLQDVTKPLFALLTSSMHMAWLRQIGGRLKSDYRYSIGLVYNTFPPPPAEPETLELLSPLADAVLEARADHPGATLADSTTRTSCRPAFADPTGRSTAPSTVCTGGAVSTPSATALNTCSASTNGCTPPSPPRLRQRRNAGAGQDGRREPDAPAESSTGRERGKPRSHRELPLQLRRRCRARCGVPAVDLSSPDKQARQADKGRDCHCGAKEGLVVRQQVRARSQSTRHDEKCQYLAGSGHEAPLSEGLLLHGMHMGLLLLRHRDDPVGGALLNLFVLPERPGRRQGSRVFLV